MVNKYTVACMIGGDVMDMWDSLVKGALLHDIGKVVYRANEGTGAHSKRGKEFLEPYIDNVNYKNDVLHCVQYHHAAELKNASSYLSDDDYAYIVYEADNIAAAVDRRDYDEGENSESSSLQFDKYMPLQSIFRVFGDAVSKKSLHYPLRGLNVEDHFNYPVIEEVDVSDAGLRASADMYKKIYRTLIDNFQQCSIDTMSINELLRIYEDTVSYIPSSTNTKEVADISLFMHSKITAAVALSMAMYFEEQHITNYKELCFVHNKTFREQSAFCIISGDISGIQQFIYTIPSKGALKSLRGRSFYLEILMEQVLDELLEVLGLSRVNLIYNGGGHFYILAPNTTAIHEAISQFEIDVNTWLLDRFGTQLYVALGYAPATANELIASDGQRSIFRAVSQSVANSKSNRYSEQNLMDLFDCNSSYNTVDGERECSICHISSKQLVPYGDSSDSESCISCYQLFRLGQEIVTHDDSVFVVAETTDHDSGIDIYQTTMAYAGRSIDKEKQMVSPNKTQYGVKLFVLREQELKEFKQSPSKRVLRIYSKNRALTGEQVYNRLWIADYVARKPDGRVYEFEELAKASGTSDDKGIKRLGVLRADVDNLGAAFIGGFIKEGLDNPYKYGTLSRYADLSRDLAMFFKVAVNKMAGGDVSGTVDIESPFKIWQSSSNDNKLVHVIYSGGDDVFLVGAWDHLLELAIDIQTKLDELTDGKITMSAGLALFSPSYPISQMANITGELESAAKNNPGKNSIALFGFETENNNSELTCQHVYHWDELTGNVIMDKLGSLEEYFTIPGITDSDHTKMILNKSFAYKLMNLLQEILRECSDNKHINIARILYFLARIEPKKSDPSYGLYKDFVQIMNRWIRNKESCRELLTALNLIVYYMRDSK
ncbi:type III-A CRISPR-associated protein Cas10/Csm1 [Veillonella caviae]|uniref:type III-A CRISPR-associated protein Cas10/Csm1 n=1 Tax=Veillonella caviae TaxID=248316 RepID=UPI0023F64674|nr:type III-A CRISPR-associated protein Cas10/Csm1 [Veillonella caviae]